MNEAEWLTRKKRIDTRLRALNPPWQIILDGYLVDYEPVASNPRCA